MKIYLLTDKDIEEIKNELIKDHKLYTNTVKVHVNNVEDLIKKKAEKNENL